ncbi:peptidoglycan D,D-transpeptidase FtsI family protein [Amycolatopsis jiangsuensis]|uniref:Cell division protein FtsI (Penicillin-binding protein 3) n=1 Tax=Amycolatopsis jiangsuensis TaxID=1181879 RepID=A0A840IMJ2_9PSEU|nr:penicillin-binding protein 2 [Amycolatopsis jiangsuensis]MBB4682789.1 cell division protein FtsI (penicillin-binding protein 3) [Amycolatopsis jiangsuensis]
MAAGGQRRARATGSARRTYAAGTRRAVAKRGNGGQRSRYSAVRILLVVIMVVAGAKLVQVQWFEAPALSAAAERQRTLTIDIPAERGSIVDRNGAKLAFSVETRTLSVNLRALHKSMDEYAKEHPQKGRTFETEVTAAAKLIAQKVPNLTTEQEQLKLLHKPQSFTYLVDDVEPSVADDIVEQYPWISVENRAKREYPGDTLGSNIVGLANWRMDDPDVSKHNLHGVVGLERSRDDALAGTPGREIVNTQNGNDNLYLPGTEHVLQAAVPGSDLELTLDSDVQYELQRQLSDYVAQSNAKGGQAVVMDAKTGEVYGLADAKTFNPNDPSTLENDLLNNRPVTTPYEPGSVNKVVTATAAIDGGIASPTSTLQVPGTIKIADRTVHDAWTHGTQTFTTTGVFAKSSNVGTLELAQKVGPDKYLEMLKKFGIGARTGIGLPGESSGYVPARDQWSASTFGNLPIGQGLSMTVVQMAGMYQAIANDGLRVPPRIVKSEKKPDGSVVPEPAPKTEQVVSPQTAKTVRDMLRAVVQNAKSPNAGTAPSAALEGYQISGKTGTGQQIDPRTKAYSGSLANITFAGILPADNPRFVVGIRLDAPDTTLPAGHSAGPLFHSIASYLAQRYQIPVSGAESPVVPLVVS